MGRASSFPILGSHLLSVSPHPGQGTRKDAQLGQEDVAWLWPMGLSEPQSAQLGVELLTGAQGCLGQG